MKNILALVSLLIAAAACSTAPPANKDVTANANKVASEMTSTVSESDIIAKEKAAWDTIKKKDWDGFGKTLASDYLEVLDDGVHDKAASVADIKDLDLADVTFADWKMLPINKNVVLITYNATVKGTFKGQAIPPGPYREASAYVNRNGDWVTIFYQETLARTPPPSSPTPTPGQAKKQAASPMASPAPAGPDPVANEKLVWDMFRSGNYDGFASYLNKDFMEVEADAVFDKPAAVKAITGFDVSKLELSDWKSVKFDDYAVFVTYAITGPVLPSGKEYHSTIWANRDGKWQALFHQGTPAMKADTPKPEMKKM